MLMSLYFPKRIINFGSKKMTLHRRKSSWKNWVPGSLSSWFLGVFILELIGKVYFKTLNSRKKNFPETLKAKLISFQVIWERNFLSLCLVHSLKLVFMLCPKIIFARRQGADSLGTLNFDFLSQLKTIGRLIYC